MLADAAPPPGDYLLEVRNLQTHFQLMEGLVKAVDGATFRLRRGRTLAIVGESGCGKSVMARSILQIVDKPGRIVGGEILYRRRRPGEGGQARDEVVDLARLDPQGAAMRAIRGREIAMIFQEPMTSFSPVYTVGNQIAEAIRLHADLTPTAARRRAIELLRMVGMPRPERRVDEYPHQLSGGMRQRAMIAMALSCNPQLLIADEPTTALDVTTQAQILDLLFQLKADLGMSIIIITHDLGVVAEMADDVAVMYLGRVVERADVDSLFYDPRMPYTQALLRSIPNLGAKSAGRLEVIRGMVPDPYNRPSGCTFRPRCGYAMPGICDAVEPPAVPIGPERDVRCLLYGGAEHLPGAAAAIAAQRAHLRPGGIAAPPLGEAPGEAPLGASLAATESDQQPLSEGP
jgi:oligopeptide/dipeptide ABC transporter ATP-binding protein